MRVGLLGGSFDPVHYGHLRAAQCALELFELEELRLMPAGQSPFKERCIASGSDRRAMLERAVRGNPALAIEGCELLREGPSYTAETLRILRMREPLNSFTLILGSDAARGFEDWREAEEIRRMAEIRIMLRPGEADDAAAGATAFDGLNLSSTRIRDAIGRGRSIRYLAPEEVRLYIEEKGLYK